MNQLHGTYRASNDLNYEYDMTWNEHPAGLLWSATILRERKVLAHREGLVPSAAGDRTHLESLARNAVHQAIERLPAAT